MRFLLICFIFISCSPTINVVDYDDLYVKKHYNYQNRYRWIEFSSPYIEPSYYYGDYYNPWYYQNQMMILFNNNQKSTTYGKRQDRGTISNTNKKRGRD